MDNGPHPTPRHTIAHLSDPHLLTGERLIFGEVDPEPGLQRALDRLANLPTPPDALLFTGDLADLGQPEAYVRLRELVEPAAAELGAQVIWVMGNHDERGAYSRLLFGEESHGPQDRAYDLAGLRVLVLDSSVPGWHHGELDEDQLAWLGDHLATPAEHGTVLAMHHPPGVLPLDVPSQAIQLDGQDRLAKVLEGTDVRTILAGHLHLSIHASFAGIPVSVASASCYTVDRAPDNGTYAGVDGNGAFNVVHLYDEGAGGIPGAGIAHTTVPLTDAPEVVAYPPSAMAELSGMSLTERRELLSRKGAEARAARRSWRARHTP